MIPKLKAPPWYGFSNFLGTQDRTKIRSESGDYALVSDVTAPLFSVVSAIYNVEQYLPEFLESLAQQTFDHSRVELILVNDGSLDNSLSLLEQFQSSTDYAVRVINQENAGQGAARNTGIEVAQGTWVTFPDPDDILEADYLQVVADHIELWPQAEMFATNRIMFFEDTGLIEETHPLKRLFAGGNRLTDLSITPEFFHGSAPAAFVKRARLIDNGLRFNEAIRPNFEDGEFCCRYMLASEPLVGFLSNARYIYRKRADQSSTLNNSTMDPRRYLVVPRIGYLAILKDAAEANNGVAPAWLQNMILYELSHYFKAEDSAGNATAARGEIAAEFHATMAELVPYLDKTQISDFTISLFRGIWRQCLLHAWSGEPWHMEYAVFRHFDKQMKLALITYRYTGDRPSERIISGTDVVDPVFTKDRDVVYFDRTVMKERILWVPAGRMVRLQLNGQPWELRTEETNERSVRLRPIQMRTGPTRIGIPYTAPGDEIFNQPLREVATSLFYNIYVRTPWARKKFRGSWVFMDRVRNADDSGEILFKYARAQRKDINAWFVVDKDTATWKRLRKEGFGSRLVAYGSLKWMALMFRTTLLASSHAGPPQANPPKFIEHFVPRWKFAFLQHGVIKDDLSAWLNPKEMFLFVVSTPDEYESIAASGTSYRFSDKEVALTGLPRFDDLLRAKDSIKKQDLLLLCPTWRHWLVKDDIAGTQERLAVDTFKDSEFFLNWMGLLESTELRDAAAVAGLQIAILAHPNLEQAFEGITVPSWVQLMTYEDTDVRSIFARAKIGITDYSSVAFNLAYLNTPSVYFQFDADKVLNGGHVGRAGYYKYPENGFGPVVETVNDVVRSVHELLDDTSSQSQLYAKRIDSTFPSRDGKASERVIAAIEERLKPVL
jgi:glycosyltransferase involved in cell wall biosynthesis